MPKTKCVDCGRICWNCRKCHNRTYCEFCNSCNLHGQDEPTPEMIRPPRDPGGPTFAEASAGKRLFLVQVAFFTRRGWSDTFDVRVRAKGMAGAIWQGVRQARREQLKARTHVRQVRVTAAGA